ncbi:MAG TPA: ATP synthase F1 subunit epsilon [Bacteroidales bacterium]|jgi:F-type H+-transporting ATPase subunit epsilon|nr:ATP synthase F1 subunit epsilon [Bacteroidales bacterium]
MKTDLFLEVVTPEQIVFEGPVGMVEVPGSNGRFTLLKDHAPIIASLTNGRIRVIGKDGLERLFECSGGILDCKENHVIILVDKALKQE